jgi:putative ABC transport system ATP-binding protein
MFRERGLKKAKGKEQKQMIQLEKISRIYEIGNQSIHALDAVDLNIKAGEFVAIMGRSGSGKSTLLNMIGCMDRPDKGDYLLDSKNISQMDDDELSAIRNQYMGFVFQSFHLLPRLSTLDNVLLPRRYHHEGLRESDRQSAIELLERVGLGDRIQHKPNELSGGQRQRVAIARSLINKPKVVLADEPTGNLDSSTSDAIMDLLKELNREGQTIVMVTHEAEIADNAQRQIFMRDGKILEDHSVQD